MAGSRRFGTLGFALQSAQGTAATAPLFTVPIISGGLRPQKEFDDLPRIGSNLARLGRFPTGAFGGGTVRILAHPEALGLLLYNVMGGYDSLGTVSSAEHHKFGMKDAYGGTLTFWSSVGSTTGNLVGGVYMFKDSFINRLSIEGNSRRNLEIEIEVTSFSYAARQTIPTPSGTGNSAEDDEPRFKYIESVVQMAPDTGSLATYNIAERAMLTINRDPEYRYGPSLTPTIISPDRMVDMTVGTTFDDVVGGWDWLNQAHLGAYGAASGVTGVAPNQGTPNGKFDIKFGRHPGAANQKFLQVTSNGANWQYSLDRPDAEASPGLLDYELVGPVTAPKVSNGGSSATASEITVLLANDFSTTYGSEILPVP